MSHELFVVCLGLCFAAVFAWAFRTLPHEKWQIIAAMPKIRQDHDGQWQGENLTYYGAFTATAYLIAVIVVFVMLGAISLRAEMICFVVILLLSVCVPASELIARLVEKKAHTFTVGGASFAGIILMPWLIWLADTVSEIDIPVMPVMAAIAIAYSFGEGFGRLACISFGCCYGKALRDCPAIIRKLFEKRCFVFSGKTKKIAYAHALDGQPVLPIQAITAVLYTGVGLAGTYLFLKAFYPAAFITAILTTQVWRAVSEFLRADYRGEGRISAYQIMAVIAAGYSILISLIFRQYLPQSADIVSGLGYLWNPLMILSLQGLWIAVFLYTGRSKVTASLLSFHVLREKI